MSQILPKYFKRNSLSILVGVGLAMQSGLVLSQEAAADEDEGFEKIMITASKRLKGLQETPIAVTVVGGEAIEQAKVLDIGDLQTLVPTLRVTPLQRSTNTSFAIRGFGNGGNNTGIEPSVGIFIDGVYRSRAAASIGDLPKVQQIEVLSGPQSTLFGKNASAGVISVRTEAPSYDFEGRFEAGVGNFNQRLLKGYITNGITDDLAFSLSAGMNTRDGFSDSIVGLSKMNDRDRWNLRGQALWEPMEDVTVRFIADYSEIDEICCTVDAVINGATVSASQALGGVVLSESDPFAYQSALNSDPRTQVEDGGISLQVDIDFENFAFTSITALRNNEANFSIDPDYSSLDMLFNTGVTDIDTTTQEFRLTSTGERKLDWMFGAFIFQEKVETGENIGFGEDARPFFDILTSDALISIEGLYGETLGSTFFSPGTAVATDFVQDNDAYSIFANFDYHISEQLTATFGLSYTKDEKEVSVRETNTDKYSAIDFDTPTVFGVPLADAFAGSFIASGMSPEVAAATAAATVDGVRGLQFLPPKLLFPNAVEDGKSSDGETTWSARLAYKHNENINFFATAATGFKASSWNLTRDTRPFITDQSALTTADLTLANQSYGTRKANPEESTVYELGMKARFKKGAFNVTLFDQTIEDFQSTTFVGTGFALANAGEQNTKGLEFDSVYRATDNLSLTLAGILLDPEYVSFEGATGVGNVEVDLSGSQPAGIHEQSITAGITYNFEFDNGMFGYVRTDYLYEDEVRLNENTPESIISEVSSFNASAGLNLENGVNLQVWVRNLTNDEYYISSFPTPLQGGSYSAYPSQPRTFGISVSYQFY
jgi:outer membrane receptor protein involved in Fe transport